MRKVFSFSNFFSGKQLKSAQIALMVLTSLSASGCAKAILNRPVNRTVASLFNILSIHPHFGSTAGGSSVTITGSGFSPFGTTVKIGGSPCVNVRYLSSSIIECTTTPHVAGVTDLTVINADLVSTSALSAFIYTPGDVNAGFAVTSGGVFTGSSSPTYNRQTSVGAVLGANPAGTQSKITGTGLTLHEGMQGILQH